MLITAAGARQILLTSRQHAPCAAASSAGSRSRPPTCAGSARQNEVLLTSVGDGVYGVDHEGRVTLRQPLGRRGRSATDRTSCSGRNAHDEFHAPDARRARRTRGRAATSPTPSAHGVVTSAEDDVYVRADGSTFPVEITACPLLDEAEVRGAVVVFRDVTQRREVDRMKNEFLSVVSHELRTPLTSIRGSLGLLAGGTLGDLTAARRSPWRASRCRTASASPG